MSRYILIIEPSSALAETLKDILELEGYHVQTTARGDKGVQIALKTQPDLIICNDNLTDMTGRDVLERLQDEMSFSRESFLMMHESDPPHIDYKWIQKPFSIETLLATIQTFD